MDEVPLPPDLDGTTFGESRFRESFALALLLVRRGTAGLLLPDAALRFASGDRLVVFGPADRVAALRGGAARAPEAPAERAQPSRQEAAWTPRSASSSPAS